MPFLFGSIWIASSSLGTFWPAALGMLRGRRRWSHSAWRTKRSVHDAARSTCFSPCFIDRLSTCSRERDNSLQPGAWSSQTAATLKCTILMTRGGER